ncbi:MAG: hypothetical protein ACFB00_06295 [Parvularculaceae bacterium]
MVCFVPPRPPLRRPLPQPLPQPLPKGVYRLTRPPQANAPGVASSGAPNGASAGDAALAAFPFGLATEGIHEAGEAAFGDRPAAVGFVLAAIAAAGAAQKARTPPPANPGANSAAKPIVWIAEASAVREHGRVYESGLRALLPAPPPILHVAARKRADALWAVEEAVTARAAGLVIGEVGGVDFTASRRLALAAARCGAPVVLLTPYDHAGASAAAARWRVAASPSAANPYDPRAPGPLRWRVSLERARAAPRLAGSVFDLVFDDETLSLRPSPRLAADPVAPPPDGEPGRRAG